ncbi:MKRN2 opposite strand protein [Geospiza fortis]|uniref:MKRN2 opposite strand protein n=1 Tax=Geospiza fortis TaxID=48883 RepID=A0A8N5F3W3_GEOFO|nr:MKRN2 opposite strand protein [Geospiza fortis]
MGRGAERAGQGSPPREGCHPCGYQAALPGGAGARCPSEPLCSSRSGYDGHSDLHVGISSSQGVVYNYDQEGVHRDGRGWEQCISIPLVQPDMWELLQHWDNLLEEFSLEEAWLPHRYEEQQHNCYTFALMFINRVRQGRGGAALSKAEFTERFLLARSREAARYLRLQQQLAHSDVYIVPLAEQEQQESLPGNHSPLE